MRLTYMALGLLLACPAQADILVGVAGPMSGQYAVFGNQLKSGVDAAIAKFNAAGGINGEQLTSITADDACDTRRALDAARDFIAKDVRLVIGHYCSGASLAASQPYKDAGILMITPSASAPEVTAAGHWNVFRLAPRSDAAVVAAVARIKQSPAQQTVFFVGDASPRSAALQATAAASLPGLQTLDFKAGPQNLASLVRALSADAGASVMLSLAGSESARLLTALAAENFTGTIYADDLLLSEDFGNRVETLPFDVLIALPEDHTQSANAATTVAAIAQAGGDPEGAALSAYAALEAAVAAAKATTINDTRAMAQWLKAGNGVETAMGPVMFDNRGELKRNLMVWFRWSAADNRFVPE